MSTVQLLRGALPATLCADWLRACASASASASAPPGASPGAPPDIASHSRTLGSLQDHGVLDAAQVLQALAASPLRAPIEAALGPSAPCHLDQSWLRHGRPPHSWHQDGALRFDFMAHAGQPAPPDALLLMRTCWIALTACGEHAPGLEWMKADTPHLLQPAELTEAAVAQRHAADEQVRPVMQAGDVLLFDGSLLHRTHLHAGMTQVRSSLELRFFSATNWPARLGEARRLCWR